MRPDTYQRRDENGAILIGDVAIETLAETYGTPLYVLDYDTLIHRMRDYRTALSHLMPTGFAYYAGKAFLCQAMVELVHDQGLGLDVVSGGELYTAVQAGMDCRRILFHGNVKTREELRYGLEVGVGQFVVDSIDELKRLSELALGLGVTAPVLLRLTPGIDAHTHDFIRTGQFDSKFGFGLGDHIADDAVQTALELPAIQLNGFHAHIGSQILDTAPFIANAEALLRYSRHWYDQQGYWPRILDIGGGIGVRYSTSDAPPELPAIIRDVQQLLITWTPSDVARPQVIMEPGRSIVAEAGVTVYTIEARKHVVGGKEYIAVDGGMGDNIRPALYQAGYSAEIDGKPDRVERRPVTVAGRYCESGDILIHEAMLPNPEVGDRLIVFGTGAYNYSMASTYNRVPRPAVVVVKDGEAMQWIRREHWEDLTHLDCSLHAAKHVKA